MLTYRTLILAIALGVVPQATLAQDSSPDVGTVLSLCSHCHGTEGDPGVPGWPPLPTLERDVLIAKLKGHRALPDNGSTMAAVTAELTDEQIEWIAEYFTSLHAKGEQPLSTLKK
ncbi:cytochrome c [Pontibacterium sp.]|uniref:c-type cytochrome n=1 Tax=Pontibacterium sp. TaxID=2036026 RepID=UPI0035150FFF